MSTPTPTTLTIRTSDPETYRHFCDLAEGGRVVELVDRKWRGETVEMVPAGTTYRGVITFAECEAERGKDETTSEDERGG